MSEESEKDILSSLRRTLEELKTILMLMNQDKLSNVKKDLLKPGSIKEQIYNLCDGTRSTKDIAAAIQKEAGYVHSYLSILRREGLIRTLEREERQVYEQVF